MQGFLVMVVSLVLPVLLGSRSRYCDAMINWREKKGHRRLEERR